MSKRIKILLSLSIFLNLTFSALYVNKFFSSRTKNVSKDSAYTYFSGRDQLFELLPKDSGSVVFAGNSLTQNFEFAEIFQTLKIKNRGVNGDKINSFKNRLSTIIQLKPSKLFVEIGINDLLRGGEKEEVLLGIKDLMMELRTQLKTTKIYFHSLFPVNSRLMNYKLNTSTINEDVAYVNKGLKTACDQTNIEYIDTYSLFVSSMYLNPSLTSDGVHLNGKGYLLWVDILKPYLASP